MPVSTSHELWAHAGQGTADPGGGEGTAGAGRSRGSERRPAVRKGSQRRGTAGGVAAPRDALKEDSASQTGAGAKGPGAGCGRRKTGGGSPARRQGSIQLHGPGVAHHEGRGRFRAGLQCAGCGGTGLAAHCGPERDSGGERQRATHTNDRGDGAAERTAAGSGAGRQRLLLGGESGEVRGGRAGAEDRSLHRDGEKQARRTPPSMPTGSPAEECEPGTADKTQAADQGRTSGVRRAQSDCRTGFWTDQTGAWIPAISATGNRESAG